MRFKHLALAGAALVTMATTPLVFAGQAEAAPNIETLIAGTNAGMCVSDMGAHPSSSLNTVGLWLDWCNGAIGDDTFIATASSYGTGWFSIVSNDHTASSGSYCINARPQDGLGLQLVGCNGGELQAFKKSCQHGGTELVDAQGFAINDLGGSGTRGDIAASWHFESPPPASLIFIESEHDMGTCP